MPIKKLTKDAMITEILHCAKASNAYISGEFFLTLVFRTEEQLREICRELHIRTEEYRS